jgi:hypothetical protein
MIVRADTEIEPLADVGTLWTMRKSAHVARCAVMAAPGEWELREVVDGVTRRIRRSERGSQAFTIAEEWKCRMLQEGWRQVVPGRSRNSRQR